MLRSPKYIGLWPWGLLKNIRHPATGQVTQEPREEHEFLNWLREIPELRIIDDESFERERCGRQRRTLRTISQSGWRSAGL
ncbi:MAG: hypothetical protein U0872_07085 [Planctomycetaceae bacterium]